MKHKQILLNAVTTFGQELASAGVLFLLYRFLIHAIGIERFGVWSLVLATTSVITLANQGFSTSIVKFVAKYAVLEKAQDVSTLVQTALVSMGIALAAVSVGLYPAAKWILKLLLPAAMVAEAYPLLPFALFSLWLNVSSSILLAALVGYQKITHRNYVVLGGAFIFLLLCYVFVPSSGLVGLAYAQMIQTAACFLATWILLRGQIPNFPLIPYRWDRALFREMLGYGLHFQFITVSQALREPVTKALLARFGGLAMTGYYDMASRWVVSFRELIVQANQVLIPTVSNLQERDPESLPALYRESYRVIFFLSVPTFAFVIVAAPVVSQIWIGSYESAFVRFVAFLAVGWLVNVLANPAYVFDLGSGRLQWVSTGCAVTAILNAGIGFVIGSRFGATAVVAVSAASLAVGYILILATHHLQNNLSFSILLPKESRWIIFSGAATILIFLTALRPLFSLNAHTFQGLSVALLVLLALLGVPMWLHPLRKRLLNWAFPASGVRQEISS
jgi:O-antigen/teichoic acid export membrane protein